MATLPVTASALDFKITTQPTKTYSLDFVNKRIVGGVDELAAMVQSVRKILLTARYGDRIYSGDYGAELFKLIGRSLPYVKASGELIISEAFSADARIKTIRNLEVKQSGIDCIEINMEIETVYGEIFVSHELRG